MGQWVPCPGLGGETGKDRARVGLVACPRPRDDKWGWGGGKLHGGVPPCSWLGIGEGQGGGGLGVPCLCPGQGNPFSCGQAHTCENSTFPHPSDADGNKKMNIMRSFLHLDFG